jgi:hypothetical protein
MEQVQDWPVKEEPTPQNTPGNPETNISTTASLLARKKTMRKKRD